MSNQHSREFNWVDTREDLKSILVESARFYLAKALKVKTKNINRVDESQILATENIPAHSNDQVQLAHVTQEAENRMIQSNDSGSSSTSKILSKTVEDMMKCNDPIDMPIMRIAARYMDEGWRMVFRDLGISDPEINQIRQLFIITSGVEEVIYQLLLIWTRITDDPSFGKLVSVLWENGHFKCVDELEMLYEQRK